MLPVLELLATAQTWQTTGTGQAKAVTHGIEVLRSQSRAELQAHQITLDHGLMTVRRGDSGVL